MVLSFAESGWGSNKNSSLNKDYGKTWGAASVKTPSTGATSAGVSTPTGGYYDKSSGHYVGGSGMSDQERTQAAINFYRANNMNSNLSAALSYAKSKGFSHYDPSGDTYVGSSGMSDTQRTDAAISYYKANNMTPQLQRAQAYQQKMGYTNQSQSSDMDGNIRTASGVNQDITGVPNEQSPGIEVDIAQQQEIMAQNAAAFDDVFDQLASLQTEYAGYGAEAQAALAASYTQMMDSLQATENQLTSQIKSQMGADDPAMVAAIGVIKSEAKKLTEGLLEEMNQRGVVQSGLYAKAMENMNNNTMDEVQKTIATRVTDLQNQLNSALVNMANARISIMSTYQTNQAGMLSQQGQGIVQIGLAGVNAKLKQAELQQQASMAGSTNATNLAIAQMNNQTQRYGYDTNASVERYKADLGVSMETAKIVHDTEMTKLQMQNNLDVANINASNRGGGVSGGMDFSDYLNGQEWKLQQMSSMKDVLDSMYTDYTNPNKAVYVNRADAIAAVNKMAAYGIYDSSALQYAKDQINSWNPNSTYTIKHRVSTPQAAATTKVRNAQSYAAIDDYSGK